MRSLSPRRKLPHVIACAVWLLGLVFGLFAGCGGSSSGVTVQRSTIKVHETPEGMLVPRLGSRCYNLQVKLEKRESEDKARPSRMLVRRSPKTIGGAARPLLPGAELLDKVFADAVRTGRVKTTFVVGLAGTGKSAFARNLQSRVCENLPTATIDLRTDVYQHDGFAEAKNAVLDAAARDFGLLLPPKTDAGKHIDAGLGHKPWLLLLDGLDEVPVKARSKVLQQVRAALKSQPKMHVVIFARPPVYAPAFQLPEVTGVVELLPQSCAEVDATMTVWQSRDSRLSAIDKLTTDYKLLAKSTHNGECYYRQLMTWRDVSMAMDLCRLSAAGHKPQPPRQFDGSRADFMKMWVYSDLDQITKRSGIAPQRAVELIEKMMVARAPKLLDVDLAFDEALCRKNASSLALTGTDVLCRHLFRSHVFGARGRLEEYRFANRSIRDWFIAYRIDMDMKRAPADSCAVIEKQHGLFESSDIAGFLVGMQQGRKCVAEAASALCRAHVHRDDLRWILERGLPNNADRGALIASARAKLDSKSPIGACALAALFEIAAAKSP